jgi:hypothetical protein
MTSGSQVTSSSANALDSGPDWLMKTFIRFLALILFLHQLRGVEPFRGDEYHPVLLFLH